MPESRSGVIGRRAAVGAAVVAALAVLGPAAHTQSPPLTDAQLFDDSVLQRIELQVNERDWATLRERYRENTYYPATFVWRGQTVRNVGIRSRGSGTRSGVKPGLTVDFDRYVQDQRFLGLKALALDNHLQDASGMREAITMSILAKLQLPAPRAAHAELHVNGQFFGVYAVVEPIDSVATRRLFAPEGLAGATATSEPPRRRARLRNPPGPVPLPAPPTAPLVEIPTGYLFEYSWGGYYYETYLGFGLAPYVELFEPETRENEPLETLYRPIEEMFREINEAPVDRFVERVGEHLDLSLYVRMAAAQVFMADWDGIVGDFGLNNFYLYRAADGEPHKIVAWDADNTFHQIDYGVFAERLDHVLLRRALEVPALRQLYAATLEQVAQLVEARDANQALPWLEREVVRRRDLAAARTLEDRVRPQSEEEVAAAIAFNLEFARRRAAIVREQMQQAGLR